MNTPTQFRDIKATVPVAEFGAVQWAAKRCLVTLPSGKRGAMSLDAFLRLAVLEKIRETVRGEIARGKPVPADIAALIQSRK